MQVMTPSTEEAVWVSFGSSTCVGAWPAHASAAPPRRWVSAATETASFCDDPDLFKPLWSQEVLPKSGAHKAQVCTPRSAGTTGAAFNS